MISLVSGDWNRVYVEIKWKITSGYPVFAWEKETGPKSSSAFCGLIAVWDFPAPVQPLNHHANLIL